MESNKILRRRKKNTTGFDFRIKNNDGGLSVYITLMTQRMWNDLIRFGNVLFLDA